MLTISPEAKAYALEKGGVFYLDYIVVGDCCIPYQPEPSVRPGKPPDGQPYREETIDGIVLYIPHTLPRVPLTVELNSFMGFRKLVVNGWKHC